jgi:hypothetical protein
MFCLFNGKWLGFLFFHYVSLVGAKLAPLALDLVSIVGPNCNLFGTLNVAQNVPNLEPIVLTWQATIDNLY